ncbi:MAG: tetratricopeptide repeat protein [Armatimonadetes bacterium]|nr:tetratricopeptide repeat protein [Armatimonadota bacterium]
MKRFCGYVCVLFVWLAAPALGGEEDSLAAVFVFGGTRGSMASGFAVADGSYAVTALDSVTEQVAGKRSPATQIVVVSRWTGDAYSAKVVASDAATGVAILKIASSVIPPIPIADASVLARAPRTTLGQLLSGDEVGGRFPTEMLAIGFERNADKYTTESWRASNACITEVKGQDWLFLSKVNPSERPPRAALVVKRGAGAVGVFRQRLVVEGGRNPAVFYQTLPGAALAKLVTKAGAKPATLSEPAAIGLSKAADAEDGFQAVCLALAASIAGDGSTVPKAEAAAKLRPNSAVVRLLLGAALAKQSKFEEAVKEMSAAIEIDQAVPDGRLLRGMALGALGKLDEAEKDLRRAKEENPKDIRPLVALAGLLSGKDENLDEAIKLAQEARKIAPDNPDVRLLLSRLLKRKKDYDGAIAELRAILDAAPKWGEVRVALATTYEAAGKPDLAEAEYRRLVEMEPENPDAHFILVEFLLAVGKKEDARAQTEKLKKLKLQPDAAEALKKLEKRANAATEASTD